MKFFPFSISLLAVATANDIRNGKRCKRDSDCASRRCELDSFGWGGMRKICKSKLKNRKSCNENTDCVSGRCDLGAWSLRSICKPKLKNWKSCNENSDCISDKCSLLQCVDTKCSGVNGAKDLLSNIMVKKQYGSSISKKSRDLLEQLDHTTIFLVSAIVKSILGGKTIDHRHVTTAQVDLGWSKNDNAGFTGPWTKLLPGTMELPVSDNHSVKMLEEDDFFGGNPKDDSILKKVQKVVAKSTLNPTLNPLTDTTVYEKSKKKIDILAKDMKLNYKSDGGGIPDTYNVVPYTHSDKSFSRYFFYGPFGVPLIAAQEKASTNKLGPFVVDMPLHKFETREMFRPLGARVHFDGDQKATGIYDYFKKKLYVPGDQGWDDAKFLAKTSAFVLVTVREHLVWSHLIVAQATTYHSTILLSPNHPLRRLLTIHTFRSNTVNSNAFFSLVPEYSALHRGVGFTHKAMKEIFDFSYETSNIYEPFESRKVNSDLKELVDKGKFPFISEGIEYYKILKTFVTSWLSKAGDAAKDGQALAFYEAMKESTKNMKYKIPKYSGDDSMIDLVTQIIFTVTAWHEVVGYVRDAPYPNDIAWRVSSNCEQDRSDLQAFVYYLAIAAGTSIRMPYLLREFPNFFGAGGAPAWERTVWDKFVEDLKVQSDKVKEADEIRMKDPLSHEFKHMDPDRFESSISV